MEFEQILTLIDHVSRSGLETFRYETGQEQITMKRGKRAEVLSSCGRTGTELSGDSASEEWKETIPQPEKQKAEGSIVESPLVGIFYAAPSEDGDPFVKEGDRVERGQVLAIVEAMKLMNEIESDFAGIVAEIYVKNGEMVEYGQPLFRISQTK